MNIQIKDTKLANTYYGKEVKSDSVINNELVEITTSKNSNGTTSTTFTRYVVQGNMKVSQWSDFGCYKRIDHGKVRLTDKKIMELHNSVIENLPNLLQANKPNGFGVIAN